MNFNNFLTSVSTHETSHFYLVVFYYKMLQLLQFREATIVLEYCQHYTFVSQSVRLQITVLVICVSDKVNVAKITSIMLLLTKTMVGTKTLDGAILG